MQQPITAPYANVGDMQKVFVEPALRLNEIAGRVQEQMLRNQVALMETVFGIGTRQLEAMAAATDPRDLVSRQAELASELGEKLVAAAREMMELQIRSRDEFGQVVKEGIQSVERKATERKPAAQASARGGDKQAA